MGTNHGGGVNFGRRLPPIGGQYSTPINTLLWTACSRPAAPPKWCSRLLGRLRPPQSPRCDYRPRPAIRSMLSVCMTITATAASPAARRGATASRQCRAAIPPTASCATATAMASSANRQVPAHRLRRRPRGRRPNFASGIPPISRSGPDAARAAGPPGRNRTPASFPRASPATMWSMNAGKRGSQRNGTPAVSRRSGDEGGDNRCHAQSPGSVRRRLKSPKMTNAAPSALRASAQPLSRSI